MSPATATPVLLSPKNATQPWFDLAYVIVLEIAPSAGQGALNGKPDVPDLETLSVASTSRKKQHQEDNGVLNCCHVAIRILIAHTFTVDTSTTW